MFRKLGLVSLSSVVLVVLGSLASCSSLHPQQTPAKIATELTSSPPSNPPFQSTQTVDLAGEYSIEVPNNFSFTAVPQNITNVPNYAFQDSNSNQFSVALLPYLSAQSKIPGQCAVSTTYEAGGVSAPVFCEDLILTNWFTISNGLLAKYASRVTDMTTQCSMNSPCPVQVPQNSRYSVDYVFLVPDKERQTLVEFFAGDAARIPSSQVQGFKGVAVLLHDSIIPSLKPFPK